MRISAQGLSPPAAKQRMCSWQNGKVPAKFPGVAGGLVRLFETSAHPSLIPFVVPLTQQCFLQSTSFPFGPSQSAHHNPSPSTKLGHLKHQLSLLASLGWELGFQDAKLPLPSSHPWMLLWKHPHSLPTLWMAAHNPEPGCSLLAAGPLVSHYPLSVALHTGPTKINLSPGIFGS